MVSISWRWSRYCFYNIQLRQFHRTVWIRCHLSPEAFLKENKAWSSTIATRKCFKHLYSSILKKIRDIFLNTYIVVIIRSRSNPSSIVSTGYYIGSLRDNYPWCQVRQKCSKDSKYDLARTFHKRQLQYGYIPTKGALFRYSTENFHRKDQLKFITWIITDDQNSVSVIFKAANPYLKQPW